MTRCHDQSGVTRQSRLHQPRSDIHRDGVRPIEQHVQSGGGHGRTIRVERVQRQCERGPDFRIETVRVQS